MISNGTLSHRHDNTDHGIRSQSDEAKASPLKRPSIVDRPRVIVSLVMVTPRYYYVIK